MLGLLAILGCADAGIETAVGGDSDGDTDASASTVFGPGPWAVVGAGTSHTCAVRMDGTAVCHGVDHYGDTEIPADGGGWKSIAAGGVNTCGVHVDGTVACWGGNGAELTMPPPGVFESVTMSETEACALDADGDATCWGDPSMPPAPSGTYVSLSVASGRACGLEDDRSVACWGEWVETSLPAESTYSSVAAGYPWYQCGVGDDHTLVCAGGIRLGGELWPGTPPSGDVYSDVYSLAYDACARRTDHSVTCWGMTEGLAASVPNRAFASVSAGLAHVCAITDDAAKDIVCWGNPDAWSP